MQRGPQGTLYGRNTFGGNISVISQEPTKEYSAGFNGTFGNYNLRQGDGYINLPASDDIMLRVAAFHSEHDGYVRSTTNPSIRLVDENQTAVRATLLVTPTSDLKILIHGAYWRRADAGASAYGYKTVGTLINPTTGARSYLGQPYPVNSSVRNGSFFVAGVDEGVPVTGGPYETQFDYQPTERLKEQYVDADISYDLGGVALRSITGYNDFRALRTGDLDQTSVVFPAAGTTIASAFVGSGIQSPDTAVKTFSQELQLSSTDASSRLQYIVGGYYFHDRIVETYSQVYTAPAATALGTRNLFNLDVKSYAAYGQATFAIIPDTLKLIGGVRYSNETKNSYITNFTAPVGTFNFNTQTPQAAAGHAHYDKVTYRGGIEYTPSRGHLFYATVSSGFESGGINNNSTNALIPAAYAPQTVTAYEVGSKNTLMNGRLLFNVSAFYNDYKNLQITILDPNTNLSYYQSAGAARSFGGEFEVKTALYQGLHVDATAAFLDAKFTAYTRPNPFGNTTVVNLAGNDVPMSPTFKGTLTAYYEAELGNGATLTPHADLLYSTHYYSTDYNTVLDRQNNYATIDASLRFGAAGGRYYIEGFGDNLTKKAVIYSATLGGAARVQESFSPPRTYGVRVGARF